MENENRLPETPPGATTFADSAIVPGIQGSAEFDSSDYANRGCHFSSSQVSRPPRPSRNKSSRGNTGSEKEWDGDDSLVNTDESSNGNSKSISRSMSNSASTFINHKSPRPHSGVISLQSLDFQELAQMYSEQVGDIKSLTRERDAFKNDLLTGEVYLRKLEVELKDTRTAKIAIESARVRAERAFDDLQTGYSDISIHNGELKELNKVLRRDCAWEKKQSENLRLLNVSLVSQVAEQKEVMAAREKRIQDLLEELAPTRVELGIAKTEILRFEKMQAQLEEELWQADEAQKKRADKSRNDTLESRDVEVGGQSISTQPNYDAKAISGLADRLDNEWGIWARSSNESDSSPQSSNHITLETLQDLFVKDTEATLAEELEGKYEDGEFELNESPVSYVDVNTHPQEHDTFTEVLESKAGAVSSPIHEPPWNRGMGALEGGWDGWLPSIRKRPAKHTREQSSPSSSRSRSQSPGNSRRSSGTSSKLSVTSFLHSYQGAEPRLHHGKPEVAVRDYAFEQPDTPERDHGSALSPASKRPPNDQLVQERQDFSIGISPTSAQFDVERDVNPQPKTQPLILESLATTSTAPLCANDFKTRGRPAGSISNAGDGTQEASDAITQLPEHHRPAMNGFLSLPSIIPGSWLTSFSSLPKQASDHEVHMPTLRGFRHAFSFFWEPAAVPHEPSPRTRHWRLSLLILTVWIVLSHSFFAEQRLWRDANELTRRAVVAMREEKWGGPVWVDKVGYTVGGMFGLRSSRESWMFC